MTSSSVAEVRSPLLKAATLGGFDGTASLLGVIIYLLAKDPRLIFPAALSGAVTSALSMGAAEWLSDSGSGFGAASVMALATFCGALLPALPFGVASGAAALAECAVIVTCAGIAVSMLRPQRGLGLSLAETFGILAACTAAAALLGLALPGGAG